MVVLQFVNVGGSVMLVGRGVCELIGALLLVGKLWFGGGLLFVDLAGSCELIGLCCLLKSFGLELGFFLWILWCLRLESWSWFSFLVLCCLRTDVVSQVCLVPVVERLDSWRVFCLKLVFASWGFCVCALGLWIFWFLGLLLGMMGFLVGRCCGSLFGARVVAAAGLRLFCFCSFCFFFGWVVIYVYNWQYFIMVWLHWLYVYLCTIITCITICTFSFLFSCFL